MTDFGIDDSSESVTELTRQKVFQRDGDACWLCGIGGKTLNIAHHIPAAEHEAFDHFKADGTLPPTLTVSHIDNLFPLCPSCHSSYDAGAFPDWVLLPDIATIEKYIAHEKKDYESRQKKSTTALPRTLPTIDRTKVFYYPVIISSTILLDRFNLSKWPKRWLGEPTTVIHLVARRGLLESRPARPILVGPRNVKVGWLRGVPIALQVAIGELIRLWARPTPVKNGQRRT